MEIIQERKVKNGYEVVYGCPDNVLKVVRVNSKKMFSKHRSSLEIQTIGLDLHIENLEFEEGIVITHHKTGVGHSSKLPCPEEARTKELLTEYAKEFREIFTKNEKLRGYLPTVFKELEEYLPNVDEEHDDSE